MSSVEIKIRGKAYTISCSPDEQGRMTALAGRLDKRMQSLSKTFSGCSDLMLLILCSMVLEDEVDKLQNNIETMRRTEAEREQRMMQKLEEKLKLSASSTLATAINSVAAKLEQLADYFEEA